MTNAHALTQNHLGDGNGVVADCLRRRSARSLACSSSLPEMPPAPPPPPTSRRRRRRRRRKVTLYWGRSCSTATPPRPRPAKDAPATGACERERGERRWLVTRRWQRSAYNAAHHRDLRTRCAGAQGGGGRYRSVAAVIAPRRRTNGGDGRTRRTGLDRSAPSLVLPTPNQRERCGERDRM